MLSVLHYWRNNIRYHAVPPCIYSYVLSKFFEQSWFLGAFFLTYCETRARTILLYVMIVRSNGRRCYLHQEEPKAAPLTKLHLTFITQQYYDQLDENKTPPQTNTRHERFIHFKQSSQGRLLYKVIFANDDAHEPTLARQVSNP